MPENVNLRPLSSRALKSAIDSLRPYLYGAKVLELFAGQGRFSYAALLEGAVLALMVEKDGATAKELVTLRPKKIPAIQKSVVLTEDVWKFLERAKGKELYDVIFADPPFQYWDSVMESRLLESIRPFCLEGTVLLVKYPGRVLPSEATPSGYRLLKSSVFGESRLVYFQYGKDLSTKSELS